MVDKKVEPRTFFLNESHEFTRGEKEGGGRPASYAPINWGPRAARLHSSLTATRRAAAASQDPLRERRFFMLAAPESKVTKTSKASGKPPTFDEETRYSGDHSRVFRRLGVDLLHVISDGSAIVHATPDRIDQLTQTAAQLAKAGAKEQARWVTLNSFAPIPEQFRIDLEWVAKIPAHENADVVVELQPLLTIVEADEVMRAVLALLNRQSNEALTGAGTDFSGRHWYRGRAGKKSLRAIAQHLFSVEAVHRPLEVPIAAGPRGTRRHVPELTALTPAQITMFPVVGVVDGGVPTGHPILAPYVRAQYIDPNSDGVLGDHGSAEAPTSPQAFVQRLPVATTMVSLGVPRTRIANPVVIKLKR